ncbi:SDR family oxidoreductase [Roseomonas sp. BN140053]|uniref:SDR family oxidoreductase n=1 Tax=Roseomonas sp. BN140053 TaxID=3391898 RepID=UPI0039E8D65B
MAKPRLKPLSEQVIVLTGATSGIGLATARAAAERGATLMLVARNEPALRSLQDELDARGARVAFAAADVADRAAVNAVAEQAMRKFGRIDTWINDAGAFLYGELEKVPLEDQRRVFDVTYWGLVYGTLAAAEHMKATGGAIINIGSVLSDRAIALQGPYSAAKHAVKGITDTFRMEFEAAGYPLAVTLIKPAVIDTPYVEHARNLTGSPGTKNPPPYYHPRVVARAILHACEVPSRDLVVGGGGWLISAMGQVAPRLTDTIMEALAKPMQSTDQTGRPERRDNLYEPREDLAETSSLKGPGPRKTSLLLEAQMHPLATAGVVLGVGALVVALAMGQQRRRSARERLLDGAYGYADGAQRRAMALVEDARGRGRGLLRDGRQGFFGAREAAEDRGSLLWRLLRGKAREVRRTGRLGDLGQSALDEGSRLWGRAREAAWDGRSRAERESRGWWNRGRDAAEDARERAEREGSRWWSWGRDAAEDARDRAERESRHWWSRGRSAAEEARERAEREGSRWWSWGRDAAEEARDRAERESRHWWSRGRSAAEEARERAEREGNRWWSWSRDGAEDARDRAEREGHRLWGRGRSAAQDARSRAENRSQDLWDRARELAQDARSLAQDARGTAAREGSLLGRFLFGSGRRDAPRRLRDLGYGLAEEGSRLLQRARQEAPHLLDEARGGSRRLFRSARKEARRWI